MFQEGSMVLGGKFYIDTRAHYVKIKDYDSFGNPVNIFNYQNQIVTGQTTGIQAYVNITLDGVDGTGNTKTLYVSYLSGNPNTDEVHFAPNEPLVSNVGTLIVSNTSPSVGYGSVFTLSEGVRFAKQHFIHHNKQAIVIDRYGIQPTCKVGFVLQESIVDSTQDSTLLDPALESSNFAAPGADRFMITPILTRLEITDVAGFPDYVNLFEIKNGTVTDIHERPVYNVIRDEIAKRTYDESGDYYVKGFNVVLEEHLNNGSNGGYLTLDKGGNSQLLSVQIEPGTAYVKGYEVNKLVTQFVATDKATAYGNVALQVVPTIVGSYVTVNEAVGAWNVNSGQQIGLYDTAQKRVSSGNSSVAAQTGNKIGTARISTVSLNNGNLGTPSGMIDLHLFDIEMLGSNSFSSVKSVYYNNAAESNLGADIVLSSSNTASISDTFRPLLYYVGSDYTKTLRSTDGSVATAYFFKKTSDITILNSGTFSLSSTISTEIFPYGTGSVTSSECKDIFLTLNASANISIPGTAASGAGTQTLSGTSTKFTYLNVGDKIAISGNSTLYTITSIANNQTVTVNKTLPATLSGNTFWKAYVAGDMIDLRGVGSTAGVTRAVSATSTSLSFDLKETFPTSIAATITYTMTKANAREIRKSLNTQRYVVIDCSTAGTTGPFSLGFSDVFRINSIRKDSNPFTTTTQGTDVLNNFLFDNGQRDDCYINSRIMPTMTLSNTDKLLVCLDYFAPDFTQGSGYFSIDSYPVNDQTTAANQITTTQIPVYISNITKMTFDLRNYIDFRPVFTNTATDATTVSAATINPAIPTTIQSDTLGVRFPDNYYSILFNYSYYWARRDVVAVDINGNFTVIEGTPGTAPVTPPCPNNLMSLAKLYIAPYPSLSPAFGKQLGRGDLTCSSSRTSQIRFTMRDIGVLKQRVDNIENYVSLSLLEKNALDMKILDANGLDRFKNGIFVDSFTSFVTSDIGNPDFHICYDPKEGSIRPLSETHAIGYTLYSNTNIVKTDSLLMLPYTEVIAVQQPYATTIKNVETNVFRFVGKLYLDPDSDYWVNTNRLAAQTFNFGSTMADVTPYSVVYGSWQTVVTGVTASDPTLISSSSSSTSSQTSTTANATSTSNITKTAGSLNIGTANNAVWGYAVSGGYQFYINGLNTYLGTNVQGIIDPGLQTINALVAYYGASTPVTLSGNSVGGCQAYNQTGGAPLSGDAKLSQIHTLGDIQSNYTLVATELSNFYLTFSGGKSTSTSVLTATTTTTTTVTTTTSNTYQSIISTGTQATRNYTQTFQTLQTQTQSMGDKVVAVAPIADIRPQSIAFEGVGLKASTKHYVFFDGQLMSNYVTPGKVISPPTAFQDNTFSGSILLNGAEGSSLYSDSNGNIYGFLRLPTDASKSFRTGTKEVVITDSPTNEPDATSATKAYFVAQGINQTVQEGIISTGTVVTTTKNGVQTTPIVYSNTTNTYTTTSSSVHTSTSVTTSRSNNVVTSNGATTAVLTDAVSCMAYSFKLNTPLGEEGTFLTSVDVFFSGKDPNLGVWFEVRAMDNAGNITKTQIPYSEVWLSSSQVNVSNDGSVATNVKFKNPLFLVNNQEYAFIIHTVGINPNYYVYVSVLGENDIILQTPINNRPLTGTLYLTNNNTDWNPVMRTDLKINFYRAKFQTNVTGQAILRNEARDYVQIPLSPASAANCSWFGEKILGNDTLTLSTPTGTINAGDYLIGVSSLTNTSVSTIVGSTYTMTSGGYTAGEGLTVQRANGLATSITSTVVTQNSASGKIYTTLPKNNPDSSTFQSNSIVLVVQNSNGLFTSNTNLRGVSSSNTSTTTGVTRFVYSTVQFEPNQINFAETSINYSMAEISNTGVIGTFAPLVTSIPVDFMEEKAIYSTSTEISTFGGTPSNQVAVQMTTLSDYVSPILDLNRTYSVYVHNLINSNTTFELLPYGGMLTDKYISQVITLAEGQDAEDLNVYLTAYRPPGSNSDIQVYARISNAEDMQSIYSRNWIPMQSTGLTTYSSSMNKQDWIEYQFVFPTSQYVGVNDQGASIVGYTNSANTTFSGFRQYQIKIGLQSDNSAVFPRVADLRAICLQL